MDHLLLYSSPCTPLSFLCLTFRVIVAPVPADAPGKELKASIPKPPAPAWTNTPAPPKAAGMFVYVCTCAGLGAHIFLHNIFTWDSDYGNVFVPRLSCFYCTLRYRLFDTFREPMHMHMYKHNHVLATSSLPIWHIFTLPTNSPSHSLTHENSECV